MTYSDEQLSAFIDGELPDVEMQAVREALAGDEALADRLAQLAAVDVAVAEAVRTIDQRPMPARVADRSRPHPAPVLPFVARVRQAVTRHAALAASVALFVGFGLGSLLPGEPASTWPSVAEVLESRVSGSRVEVAGGLTVMPQLSYRNIDGDYCRYFEVRGNDREQGVACRREGEWQRVATAYLPADDEAGAVYTPASGGRALDLLLDQTLEAGPFGPEQEAELLTGGWAPSTVAQ